MDSWLGSDWILLAVKAIHENKDFPFHALTVKRYTTLHTIYGNKVYFILWNKYLLQKVFVLLPASIGEAISPLEGAIEVDSTRLSGTEVVS